MGGDYVASSCQPVHAVLNTPPSPFFPFPSPLLTPDPSSGKNLLGFYTGKGVDSLVPHNFWSRVMGKYGNMFYLRGKYARPRGRQIVCPALRAVWSLRPNVRAGDASSRQ